MRDTVSSGLSKNRLRVEVIDTYAGFMAVEQAWKSLEDRDPEMTVFLSWDWLAQPFRQNPFKWSVIAVYTRNGGDLIGLLPLKYGVRWSASQKEFQTEIEAGGRLIFSEYTGFLCDPEFEQPALEAMARHLRAMPWSRLSLRYVAQHHRAEIFCTAFERPGYSASWKEYRTGNGETDNLICPHVALPDDFETYLDTCISAEIQNSYRKIQQQYFANGEYRFTHCDAECFDSDIATLMTLWKQETTTSDQVKKSKKMADNFETMLRSAVASDALFLPILWRGETPLAALGHVMDPKVGAMHFIIAGRNPAADEDFIAAVLHFHSIECAILLGCEYYDFGHGDEQYKFSYGAEPVEVRYLSIRRKNATADKVFDSIGSGAALKRIEEFLAVGKVDEARRGCRQLSRILS